MKKYLGVSVLGALMACSQAITPEMLPVAASLAPQSEQQAGEFRQARQMVINQCSGCHYHMWPSEYTPRQWKQTFREHLGRPHLSKDDFALVQRYILRASELSHQDKLP